MPRVVGFQVPGLIRDPRIRRRVRFVEAVPGEELHQIEDLLRLLLADAVLQRAVHERFALLGHDPGILLAHGLAEHVGLPHREARQDRGDAHHLFLIRDDAVRVGQDRRELRQFVLDLGLALLARDEIVHHPALQRAWAVQRVQRDQVVEPRRLRLPQEFAHARAFELEDAVRLAVREQLVGLLVIERNGVDVEVDVLRALDFVQAVADQRQRAEPEEIHLQQPDPFDLFHRPLRDDFVLLRLVERHELGERLRRDHDARGVHGGVARHPLEPARHRNQLLDALVLLLHLLERGTFGERLLERHVERGRDGLRDAVGVGVRNVHHARDVAHDRPRFHRPEGDDLRDVLAAVLARHVLDDLAAPPFAEIDVDIGQRHALGVEEALEDEVVRHRIDVGNPQAIGDEAAGGGSAPRPDGDPLLARVADEIPHDQEVPGVLHRLDHVDLVRQPLRVLVDRVLQETAAGEFLEPRQPQLESLADDVLEILVEPEAGGHLEIREVVDRVREIDLAALRNLPGVGERVRKVGEDRRHFLRRLQIELIAVVPEAVGVVHELAGADAEQNVVRLEVGLLQVVHVVGGDEVQPEILRDRLQPDVDDLLLLDALELHLQEKMVRAKDVAIRRGGVNGPVLLLRPDAGGDLALQTTAEADESFGVLREQVLVDARLVVEAFRVAGRHQLDQVVIALFGFGQQDEMVRRLPRRPALDAAIARRDVHLAPENRVDPALPRLIVEHDRREHVAVFRDRHRRHPELHGFVEQFLDAACAIEQRELGVQVEVDELCHCRPLTGDCRFNELTIGVLRIDGLTIGRLTIDGLAIDGLAIGVGNS